MWKKARPWVNSIAIIAFLFSVVGAWLVAGFAIGLEEAATGYASHGDQWVLWTIFLILINPMSWVSGLFLLFDNVKFSIGWRQ